MKLFAIKINIYSIILGIIFGTAVLLRIWGLAFGLPAKHMLDEESSVYAALYAAGNRFQPISYIYSPFLVNLLAVEYIIYYGCGLIAGFFQIPEDVLVAYLQNPTIFFLLGRMTTVVFGVLSVLVLWRIGHDFFDRLTGLLAAFFLSSCFLHVKESHYIKEDVIAAFFILLTFYYAAKITKENTIVQYVLSGISLGLAITVRYYAAIGFALILFAHFFENRWQHKRHLLFSVLAASFIFLFFHPQLITQPDMVIKSIGEKLSHSNIVYNDVKYIEPIWQFAFYHIPQGMGTSIYFLAHLGFFFTLWNRKKNNIGLLVPVVPVLFLSSIHFWTRYHFARYAIITLPFYLLGAAIGLRLLFDRVKNVNLKYFALSVIILILVVPSLSRSIKFDWYLQQVDTRTLAQEWIKKSILPNQKIIVESTFKPEYPSDLNVPLQLSNEQLGERIQQAGNLNLSATYLHALQKAHRTQVGYYIIPTPSVYMLQNQLTDEIEEIPSARYYKNAGITYLIQTSWAAKPHTEKIFNESIHSYYVLYKEFEPTIRFPKDPHFIELDYQVLDAINIFGKDQIVGPRITMYRLK